MTTRRIVLGAPPVGVYVVASVTAMRGARSALAGSRSVIVRTPAPVSIALDATVTVRRAMRRTTCRPRREFLAAFVVTLAFTATRPGLGTLTVSTITPLLVTRIETIENAPLGSALDVEGRTPACGATDVELTVVSVTPPDPPGAPGDPTMNRVPAAPPAT